MATKIYSISEAFSMQPYTFTIGSWFERGKSFETAYPKGHFFEGKTRTEYPIIDRIEEEIVQVTIEKEGKSYITGYTPYLKGWDKEGNLLFKYLSNAMNINYYTEEEK